LNSKLKALTTELEITKKELGESQTAIQAEIKKNLDL
jgi:hypothetical protein